MPAGTGAIQAINELLPQTEGGWASEQPREKPAKTWRILSSEHAAIWRTTCMLVGSKRADGRSVLLGEWQFRSLRRHIRVTVINPPFITVSLSRTLVLCLFKSAISAPTGTRVVRCSTQALDVSFRALFLARSCISGASYQEKNLHQAHDITISAGETFERPGMKASTLERETSKEGCIRVVDTIEPSWRYIPCCECPATNKVTPVNSLLMSGHS